MYKEITKKAKKYGSYVADNHRNGSQTKIYTVRYNGEQYYMIKRAFKVLAIAKYHDNGLGNGLVIFKLKDLSTAECDQVKRFADVYGNGKKYLTVSINLDTPHGQVLAARY